MKATAVVGAIAAVVALLLTVTTGPDPDDVPTADEVAARTMSPFCEGLTLNECPHSKSAALRAEIESMVQARATNRQIDEWMERNYGIVSQGRPGSGLAWLAPPAMALLGLVTVVSILRRRRRTGRPEVVEEVSLSAEDEARFEEDFSGYVRGTE